MKQSAAWFVALVLVVCVPVTRAEETEEDVALSELPKEVVEAVSKAVPGITLTEAEKVKDGDEVEYEVEGTTADGKKHEVEVSADGKDVDADSDEDNDSKDSSDEDSDDKSEDKDKH